MPLTDLKRDLSLLPIINRVIRNTQISDSYPFLMLKPTSRDWAGLHSKKTPVIKTTTQGGRVYLLIISNLTASKINSSTVIWWCRNIPVKFNREVAVANPEDVMQMKNIERQLQTKFKPERLKTEPCMPLESTNRFYMKRASEVDRRVFKNDPKDKRLVRFKQSFKLQLKSWNK